MRYQRYVAALKRLFVTAAPPRPAGNDHAETPFVVLEFFDPADARSARFAPAYQVRTARWRL
jgi:hypothetical protein